MKLAIYTNELDIELEALAKLWQFENSLPILAVFLHPFFSILNDQMLYSYFFLHRCIIHVCSMVMVRVQNWPELTPPSLSSNVCQYTQTELLVAHLKYPIASWSYFQLVMVVHTKNVACEIFLCDLPSQYEASSIGCIYRWDTNGDANSVSDFSSCSRGRGVLHSRTQRNIKETLRWQVCALGIIAYEVAASRWSTLFVSGENEASICIVCRRWCVCVGVVCAQFSQHTGVCDQKCDTVHWHRFNLLVEWRSIF